MNWQYLQFPVEEHVLKAKFINAQNASQYMDQVFTGALPRAGFVRDITKYIAVSLMVRGPVTIRWQIYRHITGYTCITCV
jgi:hypothetical protein